MYSHNMSSMSSMAPMPSMYHSNYSSQQSMHMSPYGMMGNKGDKSNRVRNPNELFVGDLSFFCEEPHLFEVFGRFGPVSEARVKKSDKGGKSLMYGFVRMENLPDAVEAAKQLNGSLFMGREIKVQLSMSNTYYDSSTKVRDGYQIHLSFLSFFPEDRIIYPTEDRIRDIMEKCGPLADIMIKEYRIFKDQQKQEGFAYVTFATEEGANTALVAYSNMDIDGIHYECILSLRNKMPTTLGNAARPNPMMSMGRPSPYGNVPYQMSTRPSYNNSSLYQSHSHLSQQPSHSNRDIHPSMYARDAYPPREQPMSYGGQGQYGGRGPMGSVPSYGSGSSMPGRGPYPPTSQQIMQRLQHQSYGTPMREQVGYRNPDSYSDDQYSERGMPVNPPRYSSNQMSSPQQSMYSSVPASLGRYGGHQERGMMSSNSSLPMPPRDSQFSSDRFNSNLQYRSQSNNNYFSSQNEDNFQENRIDSYLHSAQQEFERDLLMPSRPTARSADMLSLDFNTTSASDHSSVFSMPSVFSNNSVNSNTEDHANQFLDHHTAPSSYSIERPAETGKSFHASDFHSLNSDDHTDTMLSSSISSLSLDKA